MSTSATIITTVKPVEIGETPSTPTFAMSVTDHSEQPIHPPGLPNDRLWNTHDDTYWRHLREMWDATSNGADSRRPSVVSPISSAFSVDAITVDLEDVDLRTADVHRFRSNLPELIKAQTEAANRPLPVSSSQSLPTPTGFAGRRAFNGVFITTTTTTRGGFHDPAPPYTPQASAYERSFGVQAYAVEEKEVSQVNKWTYWIPSCKWLFWIGFIFPLLWILGSLTLFLGVHHAPALCVENGVSKLSKFVNQAQIDEKHRLEREIIWAKRCAWATAAAFCVVPVVVCLAIVAPRTMGGATGA